MSPTEKRFAFWAMVLMALTVAFGALGAHALQKVLSEEQLTSFNTGVRYQAWHALGLLMVQLLPLSIASAKIKTWSSRLMVAGILCFSFSIYLLNLRFVLGISEVAAVFGPITPLGGLLLMASWTLLAVGILRSKSVKSTL
jgi:uncharacterized membrane protein YgdD (TMEM256/DUF423 family)